MTVIRNDLSIYDATAAQWWSDDIRWVRALKSMVPARLKWFDTFVTWRGAEVLDLGCAGGFMSEAIDDLGGRVTGIDPAKDAIAAARAHATAAQRDIAYDVGVGEALPYADDRFDIVVCVDVLEHVEDVQKVLGETARVLRPGGTFLFDTINRTLLARFAVITMAEDVLRLLPKGTHDPALFIRPSELEAGLGAAGLETGPFTGLGPRGITRRGDPVFGQLPLTQILYMGMAEKPRRGA